MYRMLTDQNREARAEHVRAELKKYLRDSPQFLSLSRDKQVDLYRDMLTRGLEAAESRALAANDLDPTRLDDIAGLAGSFLDEVDFPTFVRDLITGTYDSIVQSSIQQMDAYTKMYKELAKPLAAIAREISEADALGQVAADDPLRFTMGGDGALTDNDTGMKLDTSNDEVQKLMFQAKLKLAKERRLLLRETMLMGINRLVVEKGTIKAGLVFAVRSNEAFQGAEKKTDIVQRGSQGGGSFFGLFGGGANKKSTTITVSSRELKTNTELAATITGSVEVNFKSDYFRLDNFADLFGDESTKAVIAERENQRAKQGTGNNAVQQVA